MGEVLPELFVDPLWERESREAAAAAAVERAKEVPLVPGLTPPDERRIVWESSERERWLKEKERLYAYGRRQAPDAEGWAAVVQEFRDGKLAYAPTQGHMFGHAPDELVRPLLADWRPKFEGSGVLPYLQVLLARFELDAYDIVLPHAKASAWDNGAVLLPVLDAEVARLMADWLARLVSGQRVARAWLSRHGLAAVPLLTPDALAKRRVPREKATAALVLIASEYGTAEVIAAARCHGDEAAAGIEQILRSEPPRALADGPAAKPVRPPKLTWLDRNRLPQVLFRDGRPLPAEAVEKLLGALALSPGVGWGGAAVPYAGLSEALEYCDRTSLAAFGQAIFDLWAAARTPSRSGWVIDQFAFLADEDSVRRFGAAILRWPTVNSDKHAVSVLRAIGTDTALIQLHRITQRAKAPGLRRAAENCLTMAARQRGLSTDELADRLVPDLGLDADGTLVLDYGSRRFTVGFDQALVPFVIDGTGKRRATLPKPAASDDAALAPAAYQSFTQLKKLARATASDQIRRLERAMVSGREWSPSDFERYLVQPPLVRHLARRLVWTTGDISFRVAEDLTLADLDDATVTLPDTARVRIAHPLELGDSVGGWGEVFADYEILQPFPQLGRPVFELTPQERATGRIDRFKDVVVPVGAILGLVGKGWTRGYASDGGVQREITFRTDKSAVVVELDPGIYAGEAHASGEQRIVDMWFSAASLETITPILASEILADVAGLG